MRFYSDYTKTFYDTPEACQTAENEYLAAVEAKKQEQQSLLENLTLLKANFDEANAAAKEAEKFSRECYNELTKAVRTYYNKYGSVPKEFANLNYMVEIFDSRNFFK